MVTRASCHNCGLVATYNLPYRALITQAKAEPDVGEQGESSYAVEDAPSTPWLCVNCGLPRLETIYWGDAPKTDKLFIGDQVIHIGR